MRAPRVLVVDEWMVRRTLRRQLKDVEVLEAGGVHGALWLLRSTHVDAIVTEQLLADGTGVALLAAVRDRRMLCRRALMSTLNVELKESEVPYDALFMKRPGLARALRAWLLADHGLDTIDRLNNP